mmetsp:Transcript_30817/g.49849  ORF Transcript_30817/g.49849 Transcript_30817/m.49849 type:complete len:186 (+) Transcript_30817:110-667(+)|eukprot:CAMPEP_0184349970 /NCGR_PEP_ID=MMETSP1089-20130417/37393_1 /TAXON_ID=38269 ORGANISM="Gloeochaete wittrockiana, Strain SAG46.84" /NCGR_SAMPLE_ID=MMETSP1089 /ASSEMBLY_ACC=CAM_ASM_000445 /LENGTH=185 /DNA_ID=CAMNT_0026682503 /DNA_START=104 /DNA_END=661 /DNA_ORIENTATION=-
MFYGQTVFDPQLIILQIICMQSLHYISLGICLTVLDSFFGHAIGLEQFFSYQVFRLKDTRGILTIAAHIVNAIAGAIELRMAVERSKKCLDFAATVHLINLGITSVFGGFPRCWEWWISNFVALVAMSLLGEYLCMLKELKDIPVSSASTSTSERGDRVNIVARTSSRKASSTEMRTEIRDIELQ